MNAGRTYLLQLMEIMGRHSWILLFVVKFLRHTIGYGTIPVLLKHVATIRGLINFRSYFQKFAGMVRFKLVPKVAEV